MGRSFGRHRRKVWVANHETMDIKFRVHWPEQPLAVYGDCHDGCVTNLKAFEARDPCMTDGSLIFHSILTAINTLDKRTNVDLLSYFSVYLVSHPKLISSTGAGDGMMSSSLPSPCSLLLLKHRG